MGCPPSIDDQPQSEDAPYGYRISEPSLLRWLQRAHAGEDPDLLVAELWADSEWDDDPNPDNDIIKPGEDEM